MSDVATQPAVVVLDASKLLLLGGPGKAAVANTRMVGSKCMLRPPAPAK
jgi:hypothetical protein